MAKSRLLSFIDRLAPRKICLMGDPDMARSQLLSFIDRLAPRSKLLQRFDDH